MKKENSSSSAKKAANLVSKAGTPQKTKNTKKIAQSPKSVNTTQKKKVAAPKAAAIKKNAIMGVSQKKTTRKTDTIIEKTIPPQQNPAPAPDSRGQTMHRRPLINFPK